MFCRDVKDRALIHIIFMKTTHWPPFQCSRRCAITNRNNSISNCKQASQMNQRPNGNNAFGTSSRRPIENRYRGRRHLAPLLPGNWCEAKHFLCHNKMEPKSGLEKGIWCSGVVGGGSTEGKIVDLWPTLSLLLFSFEESKAFHCYEQKIYGKHDLSWQGLY